MPFCEPPAGSVEELSTLLPELCRYAISCSRRLDCLHPETCGTDAVTEYIMSKSVSQSGRVLIRGEQIIINYPNAKDQRKVLATFIKFKVRSKHYRCEECRHFKETCEFAEDNSGTEERGRRIVRASGSSPKTPEETCAENEMLKRMLDAAPDEAQRQALIDLIMGYSYEEIARRQHKKPATVRQWFARLRKKIKLLPGIMIPTGGKK